MKHTLKITIILVSLFLLAQIVGLAIINKYIQPKLNAEGKTEIIHADTFLGEQPKLEDSQKKYSAVSITIAILIGTAILFLLIRFRLGKVWKLWYFISVWIALALASEVFLPTVIAVILALILAVLKIYKPNIYTHNLTEVFIYTGITIIVLPFLNLLSATILLVFISIYDFIAVWKSGHMIKLAEFQTESKLFEELMLTYPKKDLKAEKNEGNEKKADKKVAVSENKQSEQKDGKIKTAILGGGDIAFPLMFSSAVMEHLIFSGAAKPTAFFLTAIISITSAIALAILFFKSVHGKYYPAMPFISAGCFLGLGIVFLVRMMMIG